MLAAALAMQTLAAHFVGEVWFQIFGQTIHLRQDAESYCVNHAAAFAVRLFGVNSRMIAEQRAERRDIFRHLRAYSRVRRAAVIGYVSIAVEQPGQECAHAIERRFGDDLRNTDALILRAEILQAAGFKHCVYEILLERVEAVESAFILIDRQLDAVLGHH